MLKPNHIKALNLFRENAMSVKEVAKACNISPNYIYDLIEGTPSSGNVGVLFPKEYKKIQTVCSKRTISNIKSLKDRIIEDLMIWNDAVSKDPKKLALKYIYAKNKILAELNKATAGVEIGEFHYHTGLSGEDLANEFKRVRSLVELAAHGSAVPGFGKGRPGVLPLSPEGEASGTETQKASAVPSEPKTGRIPSKPRSYKSGVRRKPKRKDDLRSS